MNKKLLIASIAITIGIVVLLSYNFIAFQDAFFFIKGKVTVDKVICQGDMDGDGICDMDDILQGAWLEVLNHTKYCSNYYEGGYPPKSEGVCTDVIWRALKNAGYDLKANMDKDILKNTKDYIKGVVVPDSNIDFRRVKNQYVFFNKYAVSLTTEVKPYNKKNLYKWQAGDIVVLNKSDHVAVVSDRRRKDGVPYIIHNSSTYPMEEDLLLKWSKEKRIIGHFRFPVPEALLE
ncbi:hypothetical protein LY28_00522 [Ruminiclostridium sufflavum DSM 19573]|uniref:DUF1287 domain-containing protein n=1 Tax=Ruminiclostridium sufflavum DSM 19573 TaxID=1121337 RepID=A0A318XTB0_9FIRM|nr:DUF1287 domain-containing protein [Ruminiclostridium sufflavum]PYG89922.1 hypothetical protein LY28_00522 [Ruminiclostridium sufflavum DSM 19573]